MGILDAPVEVAWYQPNGEGNWDIPPVTADRERAGSEPGSMEWLAAQKKG